MIGRRAVRRRSSRFAPPPRSQVVNQAEDASNDHPKSFHVGFLSAREVKYRAWVYGVRPRKSLYYYISYSVGFVKTYFHKYFSGMFADRDK